MIEEPKKRERRERRERRDKIKSMFLSGKSKDEIQDALGVDRRTVNIAVCYIVKIAKEKITTVPLKARRDDPVIYNVALYAERDEKIKQFYKSLNKKGKLSALHMLTTENSFKEKSA